VVLVGVAGVLVQQAGEEGSRAGEAMGRAGAGGDETCNLTAWWLA
jgi:hypothetical protein